MLALLLTGWLTSVFNIQPVKASVVIYIRADGSIDPPDAPISSVDNITYIFIDNIHDAIVIERSNITVNGNGYILQGSGGHVYEYGFYLSVINNVTIQNTNIKDFLHGVILDTSSFNTVSRNTITNNGVVGVSLMRSNNNTVSGNTITNHDVGVSLVNSSFNTVSGNTITNHLFGIVPQFSSNNRIYHNNFINYQDYQAFGYPSSNTWDDGYPSGGNFWSGFSTRYPSVADDYKGENQSILGSDGIWDSPYTIDVENQDNYPLVVPWGDVELPVADAGTDRTVDVGMVVTFDGSRSIDDVGLKRYVWTFTDVIPKTLIGLHPAYLFNNIGDFEVTLNVSDYADNWGTDTMWVHVLREAIPPEINILSPENTTYTSSSVALTFKISESTSWIGYSLDGELNMTISGNTTLSGLSDGLHNVIVYAEDTTGNIGASEIIYFSVETQQEEPFLLWTTIVIIAVVGTALLVYFAKIRKT